MSDGVGGGEGEGRGVRGADKDVKREFLIGGFHYFPMPKAEDEDFDL